MQTYLMGNQSTLLEVISAILIINLILTFSLMVANSRLKRKFKRWKGIHSTADLGEVYERTLSEVDSVREQVNGFSEVIQSIERSNAKKISTARILRYNAFSELGSDLSFSIALLDGEKSGIVISSIYGRQESRTYAKPIVNGRSNYPLTEEEEQVLQQKDIIAGKREKVHA